MPIIVFGNLVELDSFRDLDTAIYFKKKIDISDFLKLEVELENMLGYPVDIIPLNEVSPDSGYPYLEMVLFYTKSREYMNHY
ncbi:nucleotidyltransferase family protein [Desulfurococcus amylolyticus]|uniref:nucleotidyltransferase family protein n=1 Tax=Desulfurococcus amylolyticus TaxID=94694 RepID=UPI00022DFE51|nr:nucleotidyltransferase domain-containing protein [Desulfurococcus amylolyticus]